MILMSDESDISETFEAKSSCRSLWPNNHSCFKTWCRAGSWRTSRATALRTANGTCFLYLFVLFHWFWRTCYAHLCTSMHIHQLKMSKALCSSFLYLSGGFSLNSRPAPPTQQMLDKFISVSNMWNTFSVGLEEAVRQTTIPEARCICKKMDRNGNIMNLKNSRYLKLMVWCVYNRIQEWKF